MAGSSVDPVGGDVDMNYDDNSSSGDSEDGDVHEGHSDSDSDSDDEDWEDMAVDGAGMNVYANAMVHPRMSAETPDQVGHFVPTAEEKASEFQTITGLESLAECRARVEASSGSLERALQKHFETLEANAMATGGGDDQAPGAGRPERPRRENDSAITFPPPPTSGALDLLAYPVSIVSYFAELLLNAGIGGRVSQTSFVEDWDRSYKNLEMPEHVEGTFESALVECKKDLVPLVVYLHAPQHGDTDVFVRDVLASSRFLSCVNEQGRFYADSLGSRSGVLLEEALESASYPFLAVIALAQNRMQVIERIECGGNRLLLDYVMTQLEDALSRGTANLVDARRQRRERHASQSLREEQDAAFQASLREDAEKARRAAEVRAEVERAEEAQRRVEEEEEREHEMYLAELERKRNELPNEPEPGSQDACKLVVKLPNGKRLTRRFLKTHTLQMLHNYVATQEDDLVNFTLNNSHPRKVYELDKTFEESQLFPSALVMVHDLDA